MYLARTALIGDTFQIELEFRNVDFWGEGKTGVPGEKPLGARTRTNNKLNPHMTPRPGIEPGPHWWEASALTTAPSLLPSHHIYTLFSPHSFSETLSSFALTWKVRIILHYSRRCTNFFKKIYTRISRFLKPVVHNNERAHNSQMCNERLRFTCVGELKLVISQWGITKRWSELKKRIN